MANILHVVDINAPAESVFESVSTVGGIGRWWSSNVEGSDDLDAHVTIRFGEQWKVVMQRIESVANERVIYKLIQHDSPEWIGTELVFRIKPDGDWCTLEFDHRGWAEPSDFFRFCSAKWVVFLLSIKQSAETGHGTPYPNETKIGRHD